MEHLTLIVSILGIAVMMHAQAVLVRAVAGLLRKIEKPEININVLVGSDTNSEELEEEMIH